MLIYTLGMPISALLGDVQVLVCNFSFDMNISMLWFEIPALRWKNFSFGVSDLELVIYVQSW